MNIRKTFAAVAVAGAIALAGLACGGDAEPPATQEPTSTSAPTRTPTPRPTSTPWPTRTPTPTPLPTFTPSPNQPISPTGEGAVYEPRMRDFYFLKLGWRGKTIADGYQLRKQLDAVNAPFLRGNSRYPERIRVCETATKIANDELRKIDAARYEVLSDLLIDEIWGQGCLSDPAKREEESMAWFERNR